MSHESVTNQHDVVLPPSNCGQEIGKITIARDEDDCGRRWIVLDERHDIHWKRYETTTRFLRCGNDNVSSTRLSSSGLPSSFRCVDSLGCEVSAEVRQAGLDGRTG